MDTDTHTEFQIPFVAEEIGPLQSGEYRLIHDLVFGDKKVEGTTVLPNQFLVDGRFYKLS